MYLFLINLAYANYSHFATWESKPDIIICGDINVTISEVKSAIQYWTKLDYKFNSIKKQNICPVFQKEYSILIKNKHFQNKQGSTYIEFYHYDEKPHIKYIDYAIVELNQNTKLYAGENKESLTHELGHALGIDHVHNIKDIMYPYTR